MKIDNIIKVLKEHVQKEIEVHKKVFAGSNKSISDLVKMHIKDTVSIHKDFWKKLKQSVKEK